MKILFPVTCNKTSLVRKLIVVIFFISTLTDVTAQIGIGINPPDSSAILHLQDTARGLLIPRLTEAQRNAIRQPATGLMVYQTDDPAGFFYYNSNAWINMAQDNMGAHIVVLTDDITDQEAQAKIAAEVGPFTREIRIIGCTNLTTVNLSKVFELINIVITDNPLLQNVYLNNLVAVSGGEFGLSISKCPSLINLDLSSLQKVITFNLGAVNSGGISISGTNVSNLNFQFLRKVTGRFSVYQNNLLTNLYLPLFQSATSDVSLSNNTALTDIYCPNFSYCNTLWITNNNSLSVLSLPAFSRVKSVYITDNPALLSSSLPALTTVVGFPTQTSPTGGSFRIKSNPNLASITLPPFTSAHCIEYDFSTNKLNSNAVNNLLHAFAASTPSFYSLTSIYLNGQTPPAPPTGQGIIDKTILYNAGANIVTD